MRQNQEQWINEVMGSLEGIQPSEGNPYLHTRVLARLQQNPARQPVKLTWVYATVTVFVFMLVLNVLGWNASSNSDDSPIDSTCHHSCDSIEWRWRCDIRLAILETRTRSCDGCSFFNRHRLTCIACCIGD